VPVRTDEGDRPASGRFVPLLLKHVRDGRLLVDPQALRDLSGDLSDGRLAVVWKLLALGLEYGGDGGRDVRVRIPDGVGKVSDELGPRGVLVGVPGLDISVERDRLRLNSISSTSPRLEYSYDDVLPDFESGKLCFIKRMMPPEEVTSEVILK